MEGASWIQFSSHPSKRKRAGLACQTCHNKKIKCDLQDRSANGYEDCSYCSASVKECRPRQSKRQQPRQTSGDLGSQSIVPPAPPTVDIEANTAATRPTVEQLETVNRPQYPQMSLGQARDRALPSLQNAQTGVSQSEPHLESQLAPDPMGNGSTHVDTSFAPSRVRSSYSESYATDTGFLHVYEQEHQTDALNQQLAVQQRRSLDSTPKSGSPSIQLLPGFSETYWEYCYAFCPVLDRDKLNDETSRSPLLSNAIALLGSHIRPPMIPHTTPATYYEQAKRMFYEDEEIDLMLCLKALSLFYWWSPKPPTAVHRDSSWWWQSVIIRHAQYIGMHREPGPGHPHHSVMDLGLRRRIWWTAFARERLTALCQSRPAIIDLEDCNVQLPTLTDFPGLQIQDTIKAEVFIHWVRLCAILGKIAKHLSHNQGSCAAYPNSLAGELINWVSSIPQHLQLPIQGTSTTYFDHNIHQLYLPYLAAVIVLHLKRSNSSVPVAQPPAILAASCAARILQDILVRGSARGVMAITCWYTSISFLALLTATKLPQLAPGAEEDLDILTLTIKQLKLMWPTANIFEQGFERLRKSKTVNDDLLSETSQRTECPGQSSSEGPDWMDFFPFVSSWTSKIAKHMLARRQEDALWLDDRTIPNSVMSYLQPIFAPDDAINLLEFPLFT